MKLDHRSWLCFSFFAAVIAVGTLLFIGIDPATLATASDSLPAATYSRGTLRVAIPYRAPHAGSGLLNVEVLNPEDEMIGQAQHQVDAVKGQGLWKEEIRLTKVLPSADLVWHRVRYRFTYSSSEEAPIEGTDSISEILRSPIIHILGQQSYLAGSQAAVRVVVTDSQNENISGVSTLRIELTAGGRDPRVLFTGRLNERGTAEPQFRLPAGLTGAASLRYVVDTAIGSTEFTQQVRIEDKASILLTTEKPIYQPGQTIHVRALALDRARREATANRKLTFEVEDSRGNKVFKKATQTDRFGIAFAEFALADEVNLGTYHLRALMDDAGNTAEIALNVDRYVLPKFKVAVEFESKGGKARHGYRPGDHVTGTVRANYFFGKPVDGAEISVKATGLDVAMFEAGSSKGRTDRDGGYRFDLRLPDYFAGRPLSQGAARVLIEAAVKDSAGHAETRGEPITVSESPLIVTAVPEGGTLIPNLDNQVFILTSYADGKPATANIRVRVPGNPDQTATTEAGGVAVVHLKAAGGEKLQVDAADREGNRASSTIPLEARNGDDQILLRAERAVYGAGDRIQLHVFSTKSRGTAYIDIVKDGQTVLTRDVDIVNGRAELALTATPELAGTLDCNVYLFGRDARPVADHRLLFVQPAGELKIDAASDGRMYKPGDEARIRFRVTNERNEGVQAALGLQVVDEAVFALAEKQPGFAKVFFYLEQELLKPRYEIHSIGMPDIVEPVAKANADQHDRAARALFAATETVSRNRFETEVGRTIPQTKFPEYVSRYYTRLVSQATTLLSRDSKRAVLDSWGTPLQSERLNWYNDKNHYLVRCAGPDKRFGTADDLAVNMEVHSRKQVGRASSGPSGIDVNIEHDRGPFNGRAELSGTVIDRQGGALENVTVRLRELSNRYSRAAQSNDDGRFSFSAIPAGDYEVEIQARSETLAKHLTLAVRDRAVLAVHLCSVPVGVMQAAAVPMRMRVGGNMGGGVVGGIPGGIPGGAAGGVIGGIIANRAQFDAARLEAPMAPQPMMKMTMVAESAPASTVTVAKSEPTAPRVRSYFPEALYINPEIITDGNGYATVTIPLADSITTWRMAMIASTPRGALGSATSSIKVFQDFFVDLDLPVTLTQGDRVSIPVAAYNYSSSRGDVSLQLKPEDWFSLVDDTADKAIAVDPGRAGGAQFTLEAKRIGKFKLTLSANMKNDPAHADIVVREIEVVPNGREQNVVFNGRLESAANHELSFPAASIPDAGKIYVKLYPGPLSQVIEGMDAILQMPGGCFEQTSSSTYPNVLALDYMKRTKKLTPEVHAKAEGFIANGYQRLLTFEVPGGGFSWFGSAPANKILTSYGLMEFSDMSKVHDVDPRLIQRTQAWLASQQQAEGSWKPDTSFINEGATNRYNTDLLRITAYIGWALGNTGYTGPAVEKAKHFVEQHMNSGKPDTYTLAVVANFASDYGKDRDFTRQAMQLLLEARTEKDEQAWWASEETGVYSTGASASIETTGLAAQALLKWGGASNTARKALAYLAAKKDASGTWGTTQATIMALRALLLATDKSAADVRGTVEIVLNGKPVEKLVLTPDNNDLFHQFVFKSIDAKAAQKVELRFAGKGSLAYQVTGRYFVPWTEKPVNEPMSIDVAYDRARLSQDDIATATATVKNNLHKTANMVMVDLGIPPGFDLLSEDLQTYQEKSAGLKSGRLEKFTMTATQAILYFDKLAPAETVTIRYRLRAKYPIRARTFQSRVYEYYDPAVAATARPVQLEVRKR